MKREPASRCSTIGAEILRARRTLRAAGVDTPDLDARLIVAAAFGVPPERLATARDAPAPREVRELDRLLERRLAGEPVSRILGSRGFWTLDLEVTPAVLDPRPDTEAVVAAALDAMRAQGRMDEPLRILDLGVGSGAILLALLAELPRAAGTGIDISPEALVVARRNAARHGLGSRATFVAGDFGAIAASGFDLVVANPPYVRSADIAGLPREVREHDPRAALDGGADGLAAYRAIAARLPALLAPGGVAVLELGAGQEEEVNRLATEAGLAVAGCRQDLAGAPRALVIHRLSRPRSPGSRKKLGESAQTG